MGSKRKAILALLLLFTCTLLALPQAAGQAQDEPAGGSPGATQSEAVAPQPAAPTTAEASRVVARPDVSLKLGVGDLVEITVYGIPELSTKGRVASNGEISLPLVGRVRVEGLTAEEAEELIAARLSQGHFLKDPHVTVFVEEYATQGSSILGEVMKPGIYPVLGPQRLFDLISMAGGLSEKAGHSIVITHRDQPDAPITVVLSRNLADHPESNVPVQPGDTVIVRKADIVYVVGDVARPSGILVETGGITVLRAVALAGGTNRTAKLSAVRILRKGPNGMTETTVHLKKILQAKAPDLPLQADDVLVVPTSAGRILAGRTLEAAMQTATLVSVTAIP
jgi:polysaccharide biosynthesis/export protein